MTEAGGPRAKREHLKRTHARSFAELARELTSHDPLGLAAIGAPDDEYEPEAGTILPMRGTVSSEGEALDVVYEEFVRWFGPEGRVPKRPTRRPLRRSGESGKDAIGGNNPLDEARLRGASEQRRLLSDARGGVGARKRPALRRGGRNATMTPEQGELRVLGVLLG